MSFDAEELVRAFEIIDKKRREAAEEEQRKELRVQMENLYATEAHEIQTELKRRFLAERARSGQKVSNAVGRYEKEQRREFLEAADKSATVPVVIDYDACYFKLHNVKTREALIKGIGQVLAKTREVLNDYEQRNLSPVYESASLGYAKALHLLEDVVVSAPEEDEEKKRAKQEKESTEHVKVEELKANYTATIDDTLDSIYLELSNPDPAYFEKLHEVEARVKALFEATEKATEKLEAVKLDGAEKVAGQRIDCKGIEPFRGSVEMTCELPKELLLRLLDLVEATASTYDQVIRDNGLFSAFPAGRAAWKYVDGKKRKAQRVIIPEAFLQEDGDNDDSLEMTIELIAEMSKRTYYGMLDDDFTYFIDLFWYGFAKLAEFMSQGVHVDMSALDGYFGNVCSKLKERAYALGYQMDNDQIKDFKMQVKKLNQPDDKAEET